MKRLRRAFRNPAVATVLLGFGVFLLVVGAREFRLLQSAELLAYDKFLGWRAGPAQIDPRIAIIEMTERDIGKYDFPIPDDLLARLLETIAQGQPKAIGLDLYRDLAEPRDGSRMSELNRVLQQYPNIVGIFGFGDLDHPIKIPFAPALAKNPDRYGFNDFPFEFGAVRRGFLVLWDNQQNVYPSFSLARDAGGRGTGTDGIRSTNRQGPVSAIQPKRGRIHSRGQWRPPVPARFQGAAKICYLLAR